MLMMGLLRRQWEMWVRGRTVGTVSYSVLYPYCLTRSLLEAWCWTRGQHERPQKHWRIRAAPRSGGPREAPHVSRPFSECPSAHETQADLKLAAASASSLFYLKWTLYQCHLSLFHREKEQETQKEERLMEEKKKKKQEEKKKKEGAQKKVWLASLPLPVIIACLICIGTAIMLEFHFRTSKNQYDKSLINKK